MAEVALKERETRTPEMELFQQLGLWDPAGTETNAMILSEGGLHAIAAGREVPPMVRQAIEEVSATREEKARQYREAKSLKEQADVARELTQLSIRLRALQALSRPEAVADWNFASPNETMQEAAARRINGVRETIHQQVSEAGTEDVLDEAREYLREEYKHFGQWAVVEALETRPENARQRRGARRNVLNGPEVLFSDRHDRGFAMIDVNVIPHQKDPWSREEETDEHHAERMHQHLQKALHTKEIEGWSPEEQEAYQATARRLNRYYLRWRRKWLENYFRMRRQQEGERTPPTKEEIARFIRETDNGARLFPYNNKPNDRYFAEHILPTVVAMAHSVEEMEQIGHDAIRVLESLMERTMEPCTLIETDGGLMKEFFADHDPSPRELEGFHISSLSNADITRGQFKYFHSRYGRTFTEVIACHSGWRSDVHYDGTTNEFLPYGVIERSYGHLWHMLAPEHREKVFTMLRKRVPSLWRQVIELPRHIPQDLKDEDVHSAVLHQLLIVEGDNELQSYLAFLELKGHGLDVRTAAQVRLSSKPRWRDFENKSVLDRHPEEFHFRSVPGIESPTSAEEVGQLIKTMVMVREKIKKGTEISRRFFRGDYRQVATLDQKEAVGRVNFEFIDKLRATMDEIDHCAKDHGVEGIFSQKIAALRKEVERAISLHYFMHVMNIGLLKGRAGEPEVSPFLRQTNPITRTAVTSSAFLMSVGVMPLPRALKGLPIRPLRIPIVKLLKGDEEDGAHRLERVLRGGNLEGKLRGNARILLPELERLVREDRRTRIGTMAGGAKIHTFDAMDGSLFSRIQEMFGLQSTPFRLAEADHSLIIPPLPENLAPMLFIQVLGQFGLIDEDNPQIQTTMAGGDWPEPVVAGVGASMLLATERAVRFKPGAFSTTDNGLTDSRLMIRDAGVMQTGLPFHLKGVDGRTDKLGNRIFSDFRLYRILGTLANHGLKDGPFKPIWLWYENEFLNILRRYGLHRALHQAEWVYDPKDPAGNTDTIRAHEQMVDTFVSAWYRSVDRGYGIVDEVEALIRKAAELMETFRPIVEQAMPGETERLMNF